MQFLRSYPQEEINSHFPFLHGPFEFLIWLPQKSVERFYHVGRRNRKDYISRAREERERERKLRVRRRRRGQLGNRSRASERFPVRLPIVWPRCVLTQMVDTNNNTARKTKKRSVSGACNASRSVMHKISNVTAFFPSARTGRGKGGARGP